MVVDFPVDWARIGRRSGRLHQPLGEIPLGGQQLLGEPKHVVDDLLGGGRLAGRGRCGLTPHPLHAVRPCTDRVGPRLLALPDGLQILLLGEVEDDSLALISCSSIGLIGSRQ